MRSKLMNTLIEFKDFIDKNKTRKNILLIAFLILALISLCNTNNNPNPIIQRIFRPIEIGTLTFYYALIFPLVVMYICLKRLYENNKFTLLSTGWRRVFVMVVIITMLPNVSVGVVKAYKSICGDLNSIYCYRKDLNYSLISGPGQSSIKCTLKLENCSNKDKTFKLRVKVPSNVEDPGKVKLLDYGQTLYLNAKAKRIFVIQLDTEQISTYETNHIFATSILGSNFEFSIYDVKQEVWFRPKDSNF